MSARRSLLEMPGADLQPAPRAATALIMIDARHEYLGVIAAGTLHRAAPAGRGGSLRQRGRGRSHPHQVDRHG